MKKQTMSSPIKLFYKNKNLFLTGGTGFMGLVIVEKLLRNFPDIGRIYMLVRPKKGITVEERKNSYFNHVVFDRLKNEQNIESFSKKLHCIEGDITKKNLGLSEENIRNLQEEINLVIHGAAELSFTLPLKTYVESNVRATYDMLKLAQGIKQLNAFVYLSTSYSQLTTKNATTTEAVLKCKIPPRDLLKMSEEMTTEELQNHAKELLQDSLNSYSFSKNCAENLIAEFSGNLPVSIFRPAMVGHSYADPKPFFIGNNMSLPKLLAETHRGLVLFCNPQVDANMVPVDLTVNAILAILRDRSEDKTKTVKVYNYTTQNHPCSLSDAFRYYTNSIPNYEKVLVPLRYKLMAMTDADCKPGSKEALMCKEIKRYERFYETVKIGAWWKLTYENDNIDHLWAQMNDEEKKLLPFDLRDCDWKKYYSNMAAKQYGMEIPTLCGLEDRQNRQNRMCKEINRYERFYETVKIGAWWKLTYENDNIDHLWAQMNDEEKKLLPFDLRDCDWKKYYSNMAAKQYGMDLPTLCGLEDRQNRCKL